MPSVSVRADIKAASRHLTAIQKKQIPFAASQALNDTAFDARKAVQVQLPRKLNKPTPWTIRGVRVNKSSKRRLTSAVYFTADRAKYMKFQIDGGTRRRPSGGTIVMPKGIKQNKYGNIPRGKVKKLLQRPDTFIGTIKGIPGVWQRGHISKSGKFSARTKSRASNIRLLVRFEDEATYQPRFPMRKIVHGVARSKFTRHFGRRLASAVRTAR